MHMFWMHQNSFNPPWHCFFMSAELSFGEKMCCFVNDGGELYPTHQLKSSLGVQTDWDLLTANTLAQTTQSHANRHEQSNQHSHMKLHTMFYVAFACRVVNFVVIKYPSAPAATEGTRCFLFFCFFFKWVWRLTRGTKLSSDFSRPEQVCFKSLSNWILWQREEKKNRDCAVPLVASVVTVCELGESSNSVREK